MNHRVQALIQVCEKYAPVLANQNPASVSIENVAPGFDFIINVLLPIHSFYVCL